MGQIWGIADDGLNQRFVERSEAEGEVQQFGALTKMRGEPDLNQTEGVLMATELLAESTPFGKAESGLFKGGTTRRRSRGREQTRTSRDSIRRRRMTRRRR